MFVFFLKWLNCVAAAVVSFYILYVFSEEYVKEGDEDFDEEDFEDNDMAIHRRYVEEMGTSKNPTYFSQLVGNIASGVVVWSCYCLSRSPYQL